MMICYREANPDMIPVSFALCVIKLFWLAVHVHTSIYEKKTHNNHTLAPRITQKSNLLFLLRLRRNPLGLVHYFSLFCDLDRAWSYSYNWYPNISRCSALAISVELLIHFKVLFHTKIIRDYNSDVFVHRYGYI